MTEVSGNQRSSGRRLLVAYGIALTASGLILADEPEHTLPWRTLGLVAAIIGLVCMLAPIARRANTPEPEVKHPTAPPAARGRAAAAPDVAARTSPATQQVSGEDEAALVAERAELERLAAQLSAVQARIEHQAAELAAEQGRLDQRTAVLRAEQSELAERRAQLESRREQLHGRPASA